MKTIFKLVLVLVLVLGSFSAHAQIGRESTYFRSLKGAANESALKQLLNAEPGVDFMAYDADLAALALITYSANMQSFLAAADYSAMRTQLGLVIGSNVQAYDADLTTYAGITPAANVQSLLGAANYSAMRTLLTLVPGTDVQAYDAQLASVAGLSYTGNTLKVVRVNAGETAFELATVSVGGGDLLAANNLSELTASASTARANLGLTIGTHVQAYDADLTTYAGITPAANTQSLLGAANYSAMRTLLSLVAGTDFYSVSAVDSALALKANLASPTFTGTVTVPAVTRTGVQAVSATAMGALAINVAAPLNTKSISADSTLTFSGTPSVAETAFSLRLSNTDTARHTITIPSSLVDGVATTTFTVDASSTAFLTWVYDGGSYHLHGAPLTVNDLTTDATPTTSDFRQTWDASAAKHKKVAEGTLPLVSVETGEIADDAVTTGKLANMAQNTIKGRVTGSTGDPEDLTPANALTILESGGSNILLASEVDTLAEVDALTQIPVDICLAASDETTAITTGTAKATFRAPYAFTITAVRMSLSTVSSSGLPTVDINEGGTTILSTKLTCDASEKTSTTAATAAVISDSAIADDAEITIDFDVAGTGATGVKVWILGYR
jgi:hypothetical protein